MRLWSSVLCAVAGLAWSAANAAPAAGNAEVWRAKAGELERRFALPDGVLASICEQESHWRNVRGRHGEIGICQIKPSTVRMLCAACQGSYMPGGIGYGATGDHVRELQQRLAGLGHYAGPVDGIFGPLTYAAVKSAQVAAGLTPDGVVGPATWAALFPQRPYPGRSIESALFDPEENLYWAARYLAYLKERLSPDPAILAAAYNAGPGHPVVRYQAAVMARRAASLAPLQAARRPDSPPDRQPLLQSAGCSRAQWPACGASGVRIPWLWRATGIADLRS